MIKIAEHINELEFGANNIAVVKVEGKKICVGKHNDKVVAFSYKCPHAGGIMADGFFDALGNVVCPSHRYKFKPDTGYNVSGEGFHLKHWPVNVTDEGVFIDF